MNDLLASAIIPTENISTTCIRQQMLVDIYNIINIKPSLYMK